MSRLTRGGTAERVLRDQILRRERGQGNLDFPCSAGHVQDWQPYPVDSLSSYMCDHIYIECRGRVEYHSRLEHTGNPDRTRDRYSPESSMRIRKKRVDIPVKGHKEK